MKKKPKVTIIIPLYVVCERFFKDLEKFKKLNYPNFEIIVVCDKKVRLPDWLRVKLVLTHRSHTGPAEKRDIGIKKAQGEICAFIDDDAYPNPDWLNRALKRFANKQIVAVGGPGITPREDNFWQKLSGYITESIFCSGGAQHRFIKANKRKFLDDHPAYNLLVRTAILKKVGGYDCTFYGGEDTYLCLKIMEYGKIIYDPKVVIYHHRRAFPLPYLRQVSGVGVHRGYFFKRFPETSRRSIYPLPTFLTIGLFGGIIVSFVKPHVFFIPLVFLFLLLWLLGTLSIYKNSHYFLAATFGGIGIIATHITYGLSFIKGLLTKKMIR